MPVWLGFEILWKLRSVWITFFLLDGLFEAFIECKTFFHPTFFFQMRKHIFDAICHTMYDCAWMKCLCFKIHFYGLFLLLKFANFSPMHTLRACWCNLFLLYLRRYFYLDARSSHRISFFIFGTQKPFLFKHLRMRHEVFRLYALDSIIHVLLINSAWIMKNH